MRRRGDSSFTKHVGPPKDFSYFFHKLNWSQHFTSRSQPSEKLITGPPLSSPPPSQPRLLDNAMATTGGLLDDVIATGGGLTAVSAGKKDVVIVSQLCTGKE